MRLTRYTDYALRVLMHLATHPDRPASIGMIAKSYGISQNHLMKVVHDLGKQGFIATTRGRGGGLKLPRPAEEIIVGDVVRHTEDSFQLVDCATRWRIIASAKQRPAVVAMAQDDLRPGERCEAAHEQWHHARRRWLRERIRQAEPS